MSLKNGHDEIQKVFTKARQIADSAKLKFVDFEQIIVASLTIESDNAFKSYIFDNHTNAEINEFITELRSLFKRRIKKDLSSDDNETLSTTLKAVVGAHLRRYQELDPQTNSKIWNTDTLNLIQDIYDSEVAIDVNQIIDEFNVNLNKAKDTRFNDFNDNMDNNLSAEMGGYGSEPDDFNNEPTPSRNKPTNKKTSILDQFGTNLTDRANQNKIDPVIGRDKEINRIAQILSRRKKNNPMLLGEAGVGKTAVVEGLALLIQNDKCPRILKDKTIYTLDLTSLVAGTKYRGQFEERIKALVNELKERTDVITFIDEIHTIVGTGNAGGSLDVSNILKPALARGEIQCIGATTFDEYREVIEKDSALERRFQKVTISEPSPSDTIKILQNLKGTYEEYHGVKYTDESLEQIVLLAERYISQRNFPDKAIDILDEVASRAKVNIHMPQEIIDKEEELAAVTKQKRLVVKQQSFQEAAVLRDKEKQLSLEIKSMISAFNRDKESIEITKEDINQLVSQLSGIPVTELTEDEVAKLINIDKELANSVIGQDEAVKSVANSIKRSRIGVKSKNKPIATFMYVGPTGVGKTELAKTLAKKIFGSQDNLIRFDMSEYQEAFNVSKLIGAAPGYVGYDKGGELTEKIKNNPYSVILFDEVEKAHPNIYNLLLGIMDEGRATDNFGRVIDFKNTIIILTSNVGVKQASEFNSIGFEKTNQKLYKKNILEKELKKKFAPEFINRLDDIIYFNELDDNSAKQICKLRVNELAERLAENNWTLSVTDQAIDLIVKEGYDSKFGGRSINRAIQTYLEDGISDEILINGNPKEAKIKVSVSAGKLKIKVLV